MRLLSIAAFRNPETRMSSMKLVHGGKRLDLALADDDGLRHVENVVRQQPRSSANPSAAWSAAAGWRRMRRSPCCQHLDASGRIIVGLNERGLLKLALHEKCDRVALPPPIFCPARSISATERIGRVFRHDEALPHQHVGLREVDRAGARGRVGDKANVACPPVATASITVAGLGERHQRHRHVQPLGRVRARDRPRRRGFRRLPVRTACAGLLAR